MKSRSIALCLLFVSFGASAAESYSDCVVTNVAATRVQARCDFDDMQAKIPGAYRACQDIIVDLATAPGADMNKITAAVPAMRAEADARVTAFLKSEIAACGYKGEITISGGGNRFSMSIIKVN